MNKHWQNDVLMVIPSINGGTLLARMLPTLKFKPSQVVVIDQGSTDDTAAVCALHGVELLQLGTRRTYTQTCNIGAELARSRGCTFVCVSNNDIAFRSDVIGAMHAAMLDDPGLAIVAPAQIVFDATKDTVPLAYRVFWDLETVRFLHDTEARDGTVQRLEADFCELTCALVRLSAINAIGFLDDEYGFYHEDADFGFRLRKAGFSCAYLPNAQIEHHLSSTISRETTILKVDYIARNKEYFARKHLGFAVSHELPLPDPALERALSNQGLQYCLGRYGLLATGAPKLGIGHAAGADYLYTGLEGGPISERWIDSHRSLHAIFTTSTHTRDVLRKAGIAQCFHLPPGIDLDSYHPWGAPVRPFGEATTVLAMVHGLQHQLLRLVLDAWHRLAPSLPGAQLVLYGSQLTGCMPSQADSTLRIGNAEVSHHGAARVVVHDVVFPLRADGLASLYRGADCVLTGTRGEMSALAALQAAACGVPVIAVDLNGTAGFSALSAVPADRLVSSSPGDPVNRLIAQLHAVLGASAGERRRLVQEGLNAVRAGFTLRSTAMALHGSLSALQIRRPTRVLCRRERVPAEPSTPINLPARRPFGWKVARRLGTLGRLTTQFGAAWQESGVLPATRVLGREITYFGSHKAGQVAGRRRTAPRRVEMGKVEPTPVSASVLLLGYIDAQLGLGQSLRGLALAMSNMAIPFAIYPFGVGVEGGRGRPYMPELYDTITPRAVTVIEVMAPELGTVRAHVDPAHFSRSYNILRTYWELSRTPEEWRALLAPIDELWVPNSFMGSRFRDVFDGPITIVPPCVNLEPPPVSAVRPFGLLPGVFYFMVSFDYLSLPQRMNPFAVIHAFRQAFSDLATPVGLVIKSAGLAAQFPKSWLDLQVIAQDDERIHLVEEALSREDMLSLIAATDCYVSLHSSEGFELELAESMALGKPVIGTNYLGSTDFLTGATGYPIPFASVPLCPNDDLHPEGQVWADPDEAACAAAMIQVFADPAAKIDAARRFIAEHHGPMAVGQIVEARLRVIFEGHKLAG